MLRRSLLLLSASIAAGFSITACSSTDPTPIGGADAATPAEDAAAVNDDAAITGDAGLPYYTWWQNVEPIVRVKCQLCHAAPPQFGAPRSLVSYADTQALVLANGQPVHAEMVRRIRARQSPMPPPNQPALTEEEKQIIEIWSAIGAPEGTPPDADAGVSPDAEIVTDSGEPAADSGEPAADSGEPPVDGGPAPDSGVPVVITTFDVRAHAANSTAPFDLPVDDTNYVCWAFTIPGTPGQEQYAISFEPLIDNTAHLHHTLLFRDRMGNTADGPGGCNTLNPDWDMVAGWAPGRMTETNPPGVGTRAMAGDRYVLQAHYDRVMTPGETDQSGVRITLTTQPGLTEAGVMWHGVFWNSPINGANVSRGWTCNIRRQLTMFSIFPHMHMTGTRITLELQRSGQSNWEMVAEVPAWSFEDQPNVAVPMHLQQVQPGDKLKTTCWWDTGGRQISWGEASNDEMCFNFINHYPLIPNATYACLGLAP